MNRICVYCGSNRGAQLAYADAAERLAGVLVDNDIELVYGGATAGIMGVIADRVLALGGRVHGVLPRSITHKELAHSGLTELHTVDTMHERKALMADLADGFVALPGGFGTLEEIIEIVTWGQLQFHGKPCGLLNVGGYFDHLLAFLSHAEQEGFIRSENRSMLLTDSSPEGLLQQFLDYRPPSVTKWVDGKL
ncbi:MAG: TIGR00730 family Rossman fold protein [Woeseiaceae bacterium]|nr:TIGR00730 family Rossman fold protein [Woeseiaceae bacterium]